LPGLVTNLHTTRSLLSSYGVSKGGLESNLTIPLRLVLPLLVLAASSFFCRLFELLVAVLVVLAWSSFLLPLGFLGVINELPLLLNKAPLLPLLLIAFDRLLLLLLLVVRVVFPLEAVTVLLPLLLLVILLPLPVIVLAFPEETL